ncbi:MAG: DUF4367 domain-containing protein [Candidatus Fimadaptatus sp.]|jgi:hypothetical protein
MNKEYMSSEEIMRELEELKLRLAFQLEFEEEVKEVLAESEANPLPQHIADELGARVRRDMANFSKTDRHRRRAHGRTRPVAKVIKVIALVAVLITVSAGSAMAGFHMGRKVDVLKAKATVYKERTSFRLVESGKYADVPDSWDGYFYPSFIPEGFELNSAGHESADYVDKDGNVIIITESGAGAGTSLDTEDAEVSYTTVNGSEAMVIEEDEWVTVAWVMHNRFLVISMQGDRDMALQMAASYILVMR